jgi:hypothetical protein
VLWPLLAALLAAEPTPVLDAPNRPRVVFAGNRVITDDVYLSMLRLGDDFVANADTAATIERTLAHFLRDSGYELSSVHAVAHDNQIDVGINEGRLEKVVWRGRLTVKTLRFTFAIEIPHETFNRPSLDRQVAKLSHDLGIEKVWFVLVPTAVLNHVGPQLENLPAIRGIELLHEREPWELHFFFSENEWDTGIGVDLRSGYTDGLEVGLNYQGKGALFEDDRYRVAASGGVGLRRRIDDDRLYPAFSRAMGEGRWYSPTLIADLRPFVWLRGDYLERQRRDLGLENYQAGTVSGSVHIQHEPRPGLRISAGAGAQWQRIWSLEPAPDVTVPPTVGPSERLRAFFEINTELVFDPSNNRTDRRHLFTAQAVQFRASTGADPWFGYANYRYQQVISFGWHDLWLRTKGRALWSDISFHDEESVGEFTHGAFGDLFIRRAANASGEFRFSVTRDLFKVSLFHEVFVFGEVDRTTGHEITRVGTAIGPGFHALIEGMFQLDIYGSFGLLSGSKNLRFDAAVTALLLKVF